MALGAGGPVARRTLVATALGALALPSASCGIRLEDDAPRLPLVPTRTPVPAESALVDLTRDTAQLAVQAAALGGALGAELATLHRRQHTVLRTTLVRRQVPASALDAEPTTGSTGAPTGSPGPTPTTTPTGSPATPTGGPPAVAPAPDERGALAAEEGAAAAAAGDLAGVGKDLRATVAALHAQRYAAATLLAGGPPTVPTDPVDSSPVDDLAQETSGAIWLLEVVSARSTGTQRRRSDTTLAALRGVLADQLAGGTRPEAALGHPLPFEVRSPADGARLAREVLEALRAGYGPHLEPLVTESGPPGMAAATRWLGTVEVEAYRWGLDLRPFPGLE
jgi:hypothetical protein